LVWTDTSSIIKNKITRNMSAKLWSITVDPFKIILIQIGVHNFFRIDYTAVAFFFEIPRHIYSFIFINT
jgi:hypothetical protein